MKRQTYNGKLKYFKGLREDEDHKLVSVSTPDSLAVKYSVKRRLTRAKIGKLFVFSELYACQEFVEGRTGDYPSGRYPKGNGWMFAVEVDEKSLRETSAIPPIWEYPHDPKYALLIAEVFWTSKYTSHVGYPYLCPAAIYACSTDWVRIKEPIGVFHKSDVGEYDIWHEPTDEDLKRIGWIK